MPGWWSGVFQHGHSGSTDGGSLLDRPRTLINDVTIREAANTAALTQIFSSIIPGGTVTQGRSLRYSIHGRILNGSGVVQNSPLINVKVGNQIVFQLGAAALVLAHSATDRGWGVNGFATNIDQAAGALRWFGNVWLIDQISTVSVNPTLNQRFQHRTPGGGPNMSIDQAFSIEVQNAVANASLLAGTADIHVEVF